MLVFALAPAIAAIWLTPSFTTQDGPAHLYNAQVIQASLRGQSWVRDFYTVRWRPIPNWAGPLALLGLVTVLPAWAADRMITSVTLVAFGFSLLWLRWRVAGGHGLRVAALLAALLALNIPWLFGFTSFLLGACLFPITLGIWWSARERLDLRTVIALSALLAVGYFCHLVSLGLTVLALLVLTLTAPLEKPPAPGQAHGRPRCVIRTLATLIPALGLGTYYLGLAGRTGPMRPRWQSLNNPWSLSEWAGRINWVDPLTLATKLGLPFTDHTSRWFFVFAPAIWATAAFLLWQVSDRSRAPTAPDSSRPTAGWRTLAAILLAAGFLGPDSLGPGHGDYLPQRVFLLGLAALVPAFNLQLSHWRGRLALTALACALALQSVIVWDYALYCDRSAGPFIRARDLAGNKERIATLLVTTLGRFRANPLIHADNWLGIDTQNIIWNNYETRHYYFPVQFLPGVDRPDPGALEQISLQNSAESSERARAWEQILARYLRAIDRVVVWKSEPRLDAVTDRWFHLADRRGDIRVYRRREPRSL